MGGHRGANLCSPGDIPSFIIITTTYKHVTVIVMLPAVLPVPMYGDAPSSSSFPHYIHVNWTHVIEHHHPGR